MHDEKIHVIWFAIFFSTIVYGAVAWATFHARPQPALQLTLRAPATIALYAFALVVYVAAFLISVRMRGSVRTALIVRYAILEAVALLGLVAALLQQDWRLYLPTWVVAFVGFARSFPSQRLQVMMRRP